MIFSNASVGSEDRVRKPASPRRPSRRLADLGKALRDVFESNPMANVTLVRPPALRSKRSIVVISPPVGIAYLAGSLRAAGHRVTVVDGLGEDPVRHTACFDDQWIATGLPIDEIAARIPEDSESIGISCMFSQDWPYVKQIVEAIRARFPKALLVAGGEHITSMPQYVLETCPELDLCVLGEGEEAIVEIVNCFESGGDFNELKGIAIRRDGKSILTQTRPRIQDVDAIPRPAWDLIPVHNYLDNGFGFGVNRGRNMPLVATRGCPYQCTFCSNPGMWTTRWMARDPALVLDEIQDYLDRYRATDIDFYDLTAIVKKQWIMAFCELIERRGMNFAWQIPSGTRSEAIDSEVCRALYRTGCRNLDYSPESGSPAVLQRIKKRVDLNKVLVSMRAAVREGIYVKANIIMGFPDETRREVWQTIAFIARMAVAGVHHVSIWAFSPYPGSELFAQLRQRGKLPELNQKYFLSLAAFSDITMTVSRSENLSDRELLGFRIAGNLAFYGAQFAARPWRLVRTLYNLISNRQESHSDKSLREKARLLVLLLRRVAVADPPGASQ
ncbi:MAG: B12-binding domain-containing radical SAM protein [Candidatus Binataceae bacterium]